MLITGKLLLARIVDAFRHHPRQLTFLASALTLGGTGGAFAVASLGPDPAAMPVLSVVEQVQPISLLSQGEALGGHTYQLYASESVRSSDTVDSLLARLGVNDPAAASYLRQDAGTRQMLLATAGRSAMAALTDSRELLRLTMRWGAFDAPSYTRLVVERAAGGQFSSRQESAAYTRSVRVVGGTIRSSLFAAADDAQMPDEIALQVADIFAGRIDFHRRLQRGDQFRVAYEILEADGEPLRPGRVLTAEFVNAGRTHQALWFQPPGGDGGYFDFEGKSLDGAFLASPMAVSRVTSGFSMRFHPIHHTWRAHRGVDYGAPKGTPVRSVGAGRVEFAGRKGGYGNVVQIDHGRGDTTVYAHLSSILVQRGATVTRGQNIGAVGQTGWATGPHLHFEFREGGIHRDPLEVTARRGSGAELTAQARPAFLLTADGMRDYLSAAAMSRELASAQ